MTDTVRHLLDAYALLDERQPASVWERHRLVLCDALEESGDANADVLRSWQVREYDDGAMSFWYVDYGQELTVWRYPEEFVRNQLLTNPTLRRHLTPARAEAEIRNWILLLWDPHGKAPLEAMPPRKRQGPS